MERWSDGLIDGNGTVCTSYFLCILGTFCVVRWVALRALIGRCNANPPRLGTIHTRRRPHASSSPVLPLSPVPPPTTTQVSYTRPPPPEPHHHRIPIPPAISALCHSACPFRPAHHRARQAPTRLGACRLGSNHGADAKSDGRRSIGSVNERAKKLQRVHETRHNNTTTRRRLTTASRQRHADSPRCTRLHQQHAAGAKAKSTLHQPIAHHATPRACGPRRPPQHVGPPPLPEDWLVAEERRRAPAAATTATTATRPRPQTASCCPPRGYEAPLERRPAGPPLYPPRRPWPAPAPDVQAHAQREEGQAARRTP